MKIVEPLLFTVAILATVYEFNVSSPLMAIYNIVIICVAVFPILTVCFEKRATYPFYQPSVTVAVPVYNEENLIEETINAILNQDYPKNLLNLIIVDDCSTDDTPKKLSGFLDRAIIIRNEENLGKRGSIIRAVEIAESEVIVFIDSDTILKPDAVSELVKPFKDQNIGGSLGDVRIGNANTNPITRFQDAIYYTGFRFIKGFESHFRRVTCLSGVIAAYRTSLLKQRIGDFRDATFFGRPYKFGDDRDLTNLVLRTHSTVFVPLAIAVTNVPDTLEKFTRQQIRWKKGWLRGTFIASKFMWRRGLFSALYFYSQVFLNLTTIAALGYVFIYKPIILGVYPIHYFLGMFLVGGFYALDQLWHRGGINWIYRIISGIVFVPFSTILLPYILFNLLTSKKQSWGTR